VTPAATTGTAPARPRAALGAIEVELPAEVTTNDQMRRSYPAWAWEHLETRTGVASRRWAAPGTTALDLAERAAQRVFAGGDADRIEVDAVVFCTQTPDHQIPGNAALLQDRLSLRRDIFALDLNHGCSGFVLGLHVVDAMVAAGSVRCALLVTGDTYSNLIHPADRSLRCLFGDGAAVTVVRAGEGDRGLLVGRWGCAGDRADVFYLPAGGARRPRTAATGTDTTDRSGNVRSAEHLHMNGFAAMSFFFTTVPDSVREVLAAARLEVGDVDRYVFHQASRVVLEGLAARLDLAPDQVVVHLADVGNLVSTSVPAALAAGRASGEIRPGDLVMLSGFGVGLSWATALMRM
jgi:3-oxoacyl-[acyl-carrier-protein] synthase-3